LLALPMLTATSASAAVAQRESSPKIAELLIAQATSGHAAVRAVSAAACGETPGLTCLEVPVPLDRTGATPGTIPLHAEVLPAEGVQRGVMFLIAGGPGQGSATVFGLGTPQTAAIFRFLFPGYTLVAYDGRGTGNSGLLDCPALQRARTADAQRAAAAACAQVIGPQRVFYSTADHAEDLEAVRQALGFDKVGLWGVSYGTKLAVAYALAHPDRVDRLLLDSVLPPELPDPYGAEVLSRLPATLATFCSDGSCRSATRDFAGDAVALANALAAKPLQGKLLEANGTTATQRIDGLNLLALVLDADVSPGLAAELPAVLRAARLGNTQPLLRLARLHDRLSVSPSKEISFALHAATVCADGAFPWTPDTPVEARPQIFQAAVSALPPGAFGPFGTWAARFGNADFCLNWPSPSGGRTLAPGPLPDVPVLALNGGFDMRTPAAGAANVASRFPRGALLVVPGVGHSVVTSDVSGCAAFAVRGWIQSGAAPARCARPKAIVLPVPALPAPGPLQPKHAAGPVQTYGIVAKTVREAEAAWLMAAPGVVPGVYGGKLVAGPTGFTLFRYSMSRGVALTGKVRIARSSRLPLAFQGAITVSGAAAAHGILGLAGTSLRGTLDGRLVGR
jgi:pimeloyl-ACP methyl ester carboxylesterase